MDLHTHRIYYRQGTSNYLQALLEKHTIMIHMRSYQNVDVTLKMETASKVDNNIVLYRGTNVDVLNSTSSCQ